MLIYFRWIQIQIQIGVYFPVIQRKQLQYYSQTIDLSISILEIYLRNYHKDSVCSLA